MKVALLLSGLFRNNNSKDYLFEKIISKYPTDVYCQCWYTSEQNKQESEAKIIEAYSPKKLLMEKHIADYAELIKLHGINFNSAGGRKTNNQMHFSHLHGLKNVSNLFDWSQYDFIVRGRYDSCHILTFPDLTTLSKDNFYANCSYNLFIGAPRFFMDIVLFCLTRLVTTLIYLTSYMIKSLSRTCTPGKKIGMGGISFLNYFSRIILSITIVGISL